MTGSRRGRGGSPSATASLPPIPAANPVANCDGRTRSPAQQVQLGQATGAAGNTVARHFSATAVARHFSARYKQQEHVVRQRKARSRNWLYDKGQPARDMDMRHGNFNPIRTIFGIDHHPKIGRGSMLVHPESPFHLACTLVSCLLLLYVVIFVQMEVGFFWNEGLCGPKALGDIVYFDIFVDCWFIFEMLLAFVTGVYIEGRYVDDFTVVAAKYLTGSFWFDLLTCFPESIIEAFIVSKACGQGTGEDQKAVADSNLQHQTRLLALLQLLRPLRVFRLVRMIKLRKKYEDLRRLLPQSGFWLHVVHRIGRHTPSCAWSMLKTFSLILCIVHTCSCMYWLVKEASLHEEDLADFLAQHQLSSDASVTGQVKTLQRVSVVYRKDLACWLVNVAGVFLRYGTLSHPVTRNSLTFVCVRLPQNATCCRFTTSTRLDPKMYLKSCRFPSRKWARNSFIESCLRSHLVTLFTHVLTRTLACHVSSDIHNRGLR